MEDQETIRKAKRRLRAELLEKRRALEPEYRQEADDAIRTRLERQPFYLRARTVFCYVSMAEETDTRQLIADMLAAGKRVAVPRCGRISMEAYGIVSFDDLESGRFGILEPKAYCGEILPEEIDLCIIPCLCVGSSGIRLGYGGGYYDRYLPRMRPDAVRAALCRERLLGSEPPSEPHDRPVLVTITEKQVIFYEFAK